MTCWILVQQQALGTIVYCQ